jgi:hypothetical protein
VGKRWGLLLLWAAVVLSGCSTVPVGPTVMVLPGPGKTLEQFRTDDAACRPWASQQASTSSEGATTAQWQYDIAYQQCMYVKGNQIPGAAARYPTPPPTPPPSSASEPAPSPPPPH